MLKIMKTIKEITNGYQTKQISVTDYCHQSLKAMSATKHQIAFTSLVSNDHLANLQYQQDLPLSGVPYVLKDNVATKKWPTTSSSLTLANFKPNYDATIYQLLDKAGAVMLGKTVLDELGMGGTGKHACTGVIHNPYNQDHIIGGSSSGSSWAVANGLVPFAIASDTGDSIRLPAYFTGLYGLKPTWGLISRYGMFSFAPSFDTVGVLARNPFDCALVTKALAVSDERDSTNYVPTNYILDPYNLKLKKGTTKLVMFKPWLDELTNPTLKNAWTDLASYLRSCNIVIDIIDFDANLLKSLFVCYQILTFSEAMSSNSNITGTVFGQAVNKNTWFASASSLRNLFLTEVKKRFLIGAFSLNKENIYNFYDKARRIRNLFNQKIKKILKSYDGILYFVASGPAPSLKVSEDHFTKVSDEGLIQHSSLLANFTGMPSMSFPYGFFDNNLPYGFGITANYFDEALCLAIADLVAKKTKFTNLIVNNR